MTSFCIKVWAALYLVDCRLGRTVQFRKIPLEVWVALYPIDCRLGRTVQFRKIQLKVWEALYPIDCRLGRTVQFRKIPLNAQTEEERMCLDSPVGVQECRHSFEGSRFGEAVRFSLG